MLEVRLIGKFDVRLNGEPVVLSTRASQSLFAYLTLSAGTQHRRERLAGILWPDASEQKARTYLRQELWRIRKVLSAKSPDDYLLADEITVSFNPSADYWLDVDALTKLDDHASTQELIAALSVYQGDFLPGFYDEWAAKEREHLQSLFEKRIGQLLSLLELERRWYDILEWAEYWISKSQAPETAYQFLMIAYLALGDRAKAASTYERCKQALRELDLEPSEETRAALFRRSATLNIPIPLTSFIGREKELKEVAALFSKSRLVTLTGSGGVGKTRLAIQVVVEILDQFPDGIWFLDLAPLADGSFIPNTLSSLLGLQEPGDNRLTILDLLINHFRTRTMLVIFDNCEHLIEPCAQLVHTLLTSCEQLSILATSREVLRVAGELPYRVPSLEIPATDRELDISVLENNESVRLFAERAAAESAGFVINGDVTITIAQICRRLDGIPLAIELAAARVSILNVDQVLKRLDDRFKLLAGGLRSAMPRHQTLRATIEWSYDLLSLKEQILFRRLAVFGGYWTLEAAETVCSGEGILRDEVLDLSSQLVNKSLVVVEAGGVETRVSSKGAIRYRRLETIREFAREKLVQATEAGRLMDRHLEYFLKYVEEIEPHLMGPEQSAWMDILDEELGDLRLALDWAIAKGKGDRALRLFSAVGWYWFIRCRFREGEEWFKRLRPLIGNALVRTRAKAIRSASWMYYARDDFATTLHMYRQCLDIYRELGDEREISSTLQFMGVMDFTLGNFAKSKKLFEESLEISRRVNNRAAMPRVLMHLGHLSAMEGDAATREKYYEESLSIAREVGEGHLMMMVLGSMGNHAFSQENYSLAREYYKEALEIGMRLKNKRTIAQSLLNFAELLNIEERYLESARLQGYAESLFSESEALTGSHMASIREKAALPKQHLGEAAYRREFEFGRTLHLEQAAEIAMKPKA